MRRLKRSTMSLFFKNYAFVEVVYLLIRFHKTKFFMWSTECWEKWYTHTHTPHHSTLHHITTAQHSTPPTQHRERKITQRVNMNIGDTGFFQGNPPILPTPLFMKKSEPAPPPPSRKKHNPPPPPPPALFARVSKINSTPPFYKGNGRVPTNCT